MCECMRAFDCMRSLQCWLRCSIYAGFTGLNFVFKRPVYGRQMFVFQEWTDERLRWDPEISRLDEIILDGKRLWRPEFAIING